MAISFVARFKLGHPGLQFVTDSVWIGALGIHYKLGADGLNIALLLLTTILFAASFIWASLREWDRPRVFFFHLGLAESAVLGAFCAQDLALFVAFFDLMLIPFYFLIVGWGTGGPQRARAGDAEARHLHARRVVPDARGRDRDRGAGELAARNPADVRPQLAARSCRSRTPPRSGSSSASPPPSW